MGRNEEIHGALASEVRREIAEELSATNPRPERELYDLDVNEPNRKVRLEVHHVHLPKLDDLNYVDWNRREEVVRRGERFEELEPFLSG